MMERHLIDLQYKRYPPLPLPVQRRRSSRLRPVVRAVCGLMIALLAVLMLKSLTGNGAASHAEQPKPSTSVSRQSDPAANVKAVQPQPPQSATKPTVNLLVASAPASVPSWKSLPFYLDPNNEAAAYARANPDVTDSSLISREGGVPAAQWFGDWNTDVRSDIDSYVAAAADAHALPILVLYDIPGRDCGGYSAGGSSSSGAYLSWIKQAAGGIGGHPALVILEPDALADMDCLSAGGQQDRTNLLSQAVGILKAHADTAVYLDAGNPKWQPVSVIASRLTAAGIDRADGFSLNVSNFVATAQDQAYGDQLSQAVGGKHYVIDTSRNGNGSAPDDEWCNPAGRALGAPPTIHTGDLRNDAWLWVKLPWESDGTCNNDPPAGQPFWSYAVQLAHNAGWR